MLTVHATRELIHLLSTESLFLKNTTTDHLSTTAVIIDIPVNIRNIYIPVISSCLPNLKAYF